MKFFPESALVQLEYEKVKTLLAEHCRTEYAKYKTNHLRIHTKKEFIETELLQTYEFKLLKQSGHYFPNDFVLNLEKDLKLMAIPGAALAGEQLAQAQIDNDSPVFIYQCLKFDHRSTLS